jgi:polyhydroxyalkanoate synthesis repressor PhaR
MTVIKRYPNRKLYNTEAKQYITLKGIADLIRQGDEIQVIDNASGEDLTALTLTQIILEEEKNRSGLLTNSFLMNLIRAGEDRLSSLQRGLQSPRVANLWRQIDEDIRQRVQALVHQGELTEKEGRRLIDKLLQQGALLREAQNGLKEEQIEAYLHERQIPTQDDLQRLYEQIEELSHKIESMNAGKPGFPE